MTCPVSGLGRISINTVKPLLRPDPMIGTQIFLYDQTCTWTAEHLPPSVLNTWREQGDPVIDQFFEQYGEQLQHDEDTYTFLEQLNRCDDFDGDAGIVNFVKDIRQRPPWFDREQIVRGQHFFLKHSPIASVAIFSYTLILGYGFPQLNDVLIQTQYLSSSDLSQTYRRLLETHQMIIHAVTGDVDDFDQTFLDVVRVRLLHGMVRYKIKKHTRSNTAAHVPINQEDSLITLLGFSYAVLQCMEERMNIPVSMEDKQAYMHLWRYIGWLIGIKDEFLYYLSAYNRTRIISESIFYHYYLPSRTSKHLVHHSLMAVYKYSTAPWSLKFFIGLSQRLLGQEISEALAIDQPVMDRLHRGAIAVLFQIFRLYSRLVALNHPGINQWIIEATRKALRNVIRQKLDNKLRNFSLYKISQSAKTPVEEGRSSSECPCGFSQKKQREWARTNDIGVFRVNKPISSSFMFQSITFVFCLSLLIRML